MDLTGLQAFEKIMKIYGDTNSLEGTYELFLKIKQDLERLEELEKENKELWENIEKYNHKFAEVERKKADLIQENEKLKKAIGIIKDKLKLEFNLDEYWKGIHYHLWSEGGCVITRQEYELLKGVLGNEE